MGNFISNIRNLVQKLAYEAVVSDHLKDDGDYNEEDDESEVLLLLQRSMHVFKRYCETLVMSVIGEGRNDHYKGQLATQVVKCSPEAISVDVT